MAFWRRSRSEWELARRAFARPTQTGELPCSEAFCPRHDAARCSYMDPRGHRCTAAVCPDHQEFVGEGWYCALHGDTLRAVRMQPDDTHLPDVDNPGPSLVSWVARDLHDGMVEMLSTQLRPESGERITADETVTPVRGADGSRRWEQAWKIVSHTGIALKVTVLVEERDPRRVILWVAGTEVAAGTPPWFEGVRRYERLRAGDVDAERRDFYLPMLARVTDAVVAERAAGVRGPY